MCRVEGAIVPVRGSFPCASLDTCASGAVPRASFAEWMLWALCSVLASIPMCPEASWLLVLPLLSGLEQGICSSFSLLTCLAIGVQVSASTLGPWWLLKIRFSFAGNCALLWWFLILSLPLAAKTTVKSLTPCNLWHFICRWWQIWKKSHFVQCLPDAPKSSTRSRETAGVSRVFVGCC